MISNGVYDIRLQGAELFIVDRFGKELAPATLVHKSFVERKRLLWNITNHTDNYGSGSNSCTLRQTRRFVSMRTEKALWSITANPVTKAVYLELELEWDGDPKTMALW